MIYPRKNKIIEKLFSFYINYSLKKHFSKIHLKGEENVINILNKESIIFYLNHSCWWDPLVVFYLSVIRWKLNGYAIMDVNQLKKYNFFSYFGTFSVDRNNPRDAIKSINFAAQMLNQGINVLWIFPQGEMFPAEYRPIKFYNGISRIIKKTNSVYTVPITLHFEFISEQRPEIFISVLNPIYFKNENRSPQVITKELQDVLVNNLELQKLNISNKNFYGFKEIISGKYSISELFYKIRKESRID